MFDAPANLPVESIPDPTPPAPFPAPAPQVPPLAVPAAPEPAAPSSPSKKEPEDIFEGLDHGAESVEMPEMPAAGEPARPSALKMAIIALLIVTFVGGAGFGVWWFLIRVSSEPTAPTALTDEASTSVPPRSETIIETPPASSPEEVVANIPPPQPINTEEAEVPPSVATQPTEGVDTDGDGLSDAEEPLLGTNAALADSDGDGYADGAELQNGYDPSAARVALSSSSNMKNIELALGGQSILVPVSWTVETDMNAGLTVIRTGSPAYFNVWVLSKPNLSFEDWLATSEPTALPIMTRNGYKGWQTSNRLKTYLDVNSTVIKVTYEPGTSSAYDYRALYDYLVKNLR